MYKKELKELNLPARYAMRFEFPVDIVIPSSSTQESFKYIISHHFNSYSAYMNMLKYANPKNMIRMFFDEHLENLKKKPCKNKDTKYLLIVISYLPNNKRPILAPNSDPSSEFMKLFFEGRQKYLFAANPSIGTPKFIEASIKESNDKMVCKPLSPDEAYYLPFSPEYKKRHKLEIDMDFIKMIQQVDKSLKDNQATQAEEIFQNFIAKYEIVVLSHKLKIILSQIQQKKAQLNGGFVRFIYNTCDDEVIFLKFKSGKLSISTINQQGKERQWEYFSANILNNIPNLWHVIAVVKADYQMHDAAFNIKIQQTTNQKYSHTKEFANFFTAKEAQKIACQEEYIIINYNKEPYIYYITHQLTSKKREIKNAQILDFYCSDYYTFFIFKDNKVGYIDAKRFFTGGCIKYNHITLPANETVKKICTINYTHVFYILTLQGNVYYYESAQNKPALIINNIEDINYNGSIMVYAVENNKCMEIKPFIYSQ